ncbi:uncharacterized protein EV154DRAFT_504024 [Mucor mucedo]|uniref:uncharacterized protein n=1 Tax=Mucor mucedo TaxID=29922 RepID=UPI00221F5776|nr:uncharacterized protein EV154DRAFT_504024 [Mucor mucedo]KAI7892769.1 hypothetical protein EV154DRAFT_504024 [Mucor mucedo]
MMENNMKTQAPPPAYQNGQSELPGQTYYQPPPPPEGGYAPPPGPPPPANNMGQKFTQFYAPPQNRKLGLKRRLCSAICCCILIGLIIGLASGLTTRRRNYGNYGGNNNNCNW